MQGMGVSGLEGFLADLAVVLCIAALTSVLFQRLRQPVVLGYLLAGVVIGPHVAWPLVSHHETVHTLSELGVIFLMFSLGLEFSVRRLIGLGVRAALITAFDVSLMLWLGFLTARAFGWSVPESLFAGAALSISSTMIVARTFEEEHVGRELRDLAWGVLIYQDLLAILLIAFLSALAHGESLSATGVAASVLRLVVFLLLLLSAGSLVVPRLLRCAVRRFPRETVLLAAVGTSFGGALLARYFGYSVALGAFLAGSLAAESGEGRVLERLVRPLCDLFAAIFFVSIGMMIDPEQIVRHAPAILAFGAVVLLGKSLGIGTAALLTGSSPANALRTGMSLAQTGEFSFLIAGLGLGLGGNGSTLFPVAVGVAVLTALTTPWMVRLSDPLSRGLGRVAPSRLRHFAALYETWVARLSEELSVHGERGHLRRALRHLVLDAALLSATIIGFATWFDDLARPLGRTLPLSEASARRLVLALGALVALPFVVGILRCVRRLGLLLASEVLPEAEEPGLDVAAAPRRALVVGLQLAGLGLTGVPILSVTQPFVPPLPGVGVFVCAGFLLAVYFWYGATKTDQKLRAGTETILELLARQSPHGRTDRALRHEPPGTELATIPVSTGAPCVGASLAALDLFGHSGASVVCIQRGSDGVVFPDARERIRAGDVLVLSGRAGELKAARRLLDMRVGEIEEAA